LKRKSIPELGPFRYIRNSDISQPFQNRLTSTNNLVLSDFLHYNKENRHVFVYDYEGKILCVVVFDDEGDHFYLNLIENNEKHESECDEINPAPKLILFVEKVAKSLGYEKIRLDAVQTLVPYYEKLGYSTMNVKVDGGSYGILEKMKKELP